VLFLWELNGLESAAELLNNIFESFGLKINKLKTETMVINHNFLNDEYPNNSDCNCKVWRDVKFTSKLSDKYSNSYQIS